ncbi:hypothetical protein [Photobacterium rosenbergii]|uniref:Uncharacterized protein n=1 Tax=Photobacterium rosenbergii TaxID=294936 RepID=A0ABU3ZJM1_9GAMM|nr:hypothetical protein [Photobacterium rosenbergii]MDV5170314.1 hypothetical protein [Photobacterium rosenbergii]
MRKTNLMLLAAIIASPMAFADGYDYGYGYGYDDIDDVTIEGSFNKDLTLNAEANIKKTYTDNYYADKDDDKLIMKHVGNQYDSLYENNSEKKIQHDTKVTIEVEKLLAYSKIDGAVMGTEVTYGGACCKGSASDIVIDQTNTMYSGYQGASGINIAGQNVGNNSMVQQTTSTNAALVGSGGATLPGGGGSY